MNTRPGGDRAPCRLDLDPHAEDTALGRAFTRTTLHAWGWADGRTCDDAVLVVSELLANAYRHGGGATALTLSQDAFGLRIEVEDHSGTTPRPRASVTGQPGGYGMNIVQLLCPTWGADTTPVGKRVWAHMPAPTAPDPASDR